MKNAPLIGVVLYCSWTPPKQKRIALYTTGMDDAEYLIERNEREIELHDLMSKKVEVHNILFTSYKNELGINRKTITVGSYKVA
jgi:hypothetical protein